MVMFKERVEVHSSNLPEKDPADFKKIMDERCLLRMEPIEQKTTDGIIIPDTSVGLRRKVVIGHVVMMGPKAGDAKDVKPGERFLVHGHGQTLASYQWEGDIYEIHWSNDLLMEISLDQHVG